MSTAKVCLPLLSLLVLPFATAQADETTGIYAVARAGAAFNPESKFDTHGLPGSSSFDDTLKYKLAPTGEIGAGYNFGSFRLEETLGYTSSNAKDIASRARAYTLTISAFADIPVSQRVVPYIGGGMGAVRIDTQFTVPNDTTGLTGQLDSKSWGPFWHLDTGVGFHVASKLTLEVGVRYSQTFKMKEIGNSDSFVEVSQLRGASALMGVRYVF